VVVLTTSQTTTTGVLAVLADTTLSGGDVTAAIWREKKKSDMLAFHCNWQNLPPISRRRLFHRWPFQSHHDGQCPQEFGSRDKRSPRSSIHPGGLINVLLAGL
jgi:hypothetical protein